MNLSDVAADIAAQIESCFSGICDYDVFRARATPPADCNTIALVWGDRSEIRESDCARLEPCSSIVTQDLSISITKCCLKPDTGDGFDFAAEDHEEVCFENDLQILVDCIRCTDWTQLGLDHGIDGFVLETIRRDGSVEGGCFTAYLNTVVTYNECC